MLHLEIFENGPFMVNTYLLANRESGRALIIDPGSHIAPLLKFIDDEGVAIEAILNTHGHIDHVAGVNLVKEKHPAPFYLNMKERDIVESTSFQARMFGVRDPGPITIDRQLPDSGSLSLAGIEIELLPTPGHSPGSLSFRIDTMLFSGDALFNFSIGRTDLPGGDYQQLIDSIRNYIFTLPGGTRVLPGHGPETTVEREMKLNPFFN